MIKKDFFNKDNMENVKSTISINDVIKQLHKTIEKNDQDYYTIPDSRSTPNSFSFATFLPKPAPPVTDLKLEKT